MSAYVLKLRRKCGRVFRPSGVLQRNCCKFLGARECSAGEVIFREGDCCDTLYIIVDGEVSLSAAAAAAAAGSSSSSGGRQPQQRVSRKGWLLSRRGRS
jgi:hypothetical protein